MIFTQTSENGSVRYGGNEIFPATVEIINFSIPVDYTVHFFGSVKSSSAGEFRKCL